MALNNTKDLDLHLPLEVLTNYPATYKPEYKGYEFLNCYLYLNDYDNRHCMKYYTGRFKGFHAKCPGGIKVLALYKTDLDDFSKRNLCRSSLYSSSRDRNQIESKLHAISLRKCIMWIDKYPIYKKELLLLYSRLLQTNTPLPADCFTTISHFLKPNGRDGFELFLDTY